MSSLPSSYLSKPYGILKKFTIGGETYIGEYADAVNTNLAAVNVSFNNTLDQILRASAANERAKEMTFFNDLESKLFPQNSILPRPVIYDDIQTMINNLKTPKQGVSASSISQLIDTLLKLELGLYDFNKSLQENKAILDSFNSIALSKTLMKALNTAFGAVKQGKSYKYNDTVLEKSGQVIIDDIISAVDAVFKPIIDTADTNQYTKKQNDMIKQLEGVYRKELEQFYTTKFGLISDLDLLNTDLKTLDEKIKNYNFGAKSKDKINADSKPIIQYIHEYFMGSLGGLPHEINIDLMGGGARTGKVKKGGKNIDADNILLGTAQLDFFPPDLEKLADKINDDKKNIQFEDLKNQINATEALKDGLVIMISGKDQSTNKSFNNVLATNTKIKLKDPGSLKTRRSEIEGMFNAVGCGGDVDDLIFALANLAIDFVYEGKAEMAKKNLGTVCIAWMFDDAIEIVKGGSIFKTEANISTLHFYNINNYIYTLSDILYLTADNVSKIGNPGEPKTMQYVNIGITGISGKNAVNPYTTLLAEHANLQGIARWDYVSDELMTNIKISANMNVKNLFRDLFKF